MTTTVKITLNTQGVRRLLRSAEAQADLERRARRIAAAAGPGFIAIGDPGPTRARAVVVTASFEARKAEATTRKLSRSVDAGRG